MPKGKPIAPLDLDELEKSPSLNGMLAFRETPAAGRDYDNIIPVGATPIGVSPLGVNHRLTTTAVESAALSVSAEPLGTEPALSDVLAQLADVPRPAKNHGKTIRATRVEDGHSQTQDALYWYLWRAGKQVNSSRSRFVQAGYGQIQAALGIDRSNVQDAVRELLKKLSLRVFRASTVGSATIYEVFCCEDILAKRRSEGLLWARRYGTRRADLLTSLEQEPRLISGVNPVGVGPVGVGPVDMIASGGLTPTAPIGSAPTQGVGVTPIQRVKEATSKLTTTTSSLKAVLQSIQDELGPVDDAAVRQIVEGCYRRVPDATDDEIEHYVRLQARRVRGMRRVENPIGLLIAQVPRCFEGESFRQFRRQRAQGREVVTDARAQDYFADLKEKLENPDISEDEKQLIRQILAKTS